MHKPFQETFDISVDPFIHHPTEDSYNCRVDSGFKCVGENCANESTCKGNSCLIFDINATCVKHEGGQHICTCPSGQGSKSLVRII